MRESDIVNAVMSTFSNVQNVEVDGDTPGMVTITVTTDLLQQQEIYDLRISILQMLEPRRPAGIGYDVVMKRFDDGSVVFMREINSGPWAGSLVNIYAGDVASTAEPRRSRFDAIALELTEEVAPLKKQPPTNEPQLRATRLFEQTIEVRDGKPSPCPKCGCQAFTPDAEGRRGICRGCALPAPVYSFEFVDKTKPATRQYKCCRCGNTTPVTMEMTQINLYCNCGGLTLHDVQRQQTRVFSGTRAVMTFNGVKLEGFAEDVEIVEITPVDETVGLDKYIPGSFSASFTMQSDKPFDTSALAKAVDSMQNAEMKRDWATAIQKLSERVSAEYGLTYEQLAEKYVEERDAVNASPAAQLTELFREKLDLLPFRMWEVQTRNENILREGRGQMRADGGDRDRRTGRTTRGLVRAIAQFMTSSLRMFCVVGHTERYTIELAKEAKRMYDQLNLARAMPIKPLMPSDFDPRYDYTRTQQCHVYVDHVYEERRR